MKAAYDACFDGVVRIILQTDDHSELQVFYLPHFFLKDFVTFNFTSQITYYHTGYQNATESLAAFVSGGKQEILTWGSGFTMKSLLAAASRLSTSFHFAFSNVPYW